MLSDKKADDPQNMRKQCDLSVSADRSFLFAKNLLRPEQMFDMIGSQRNKSRLLTIEFLETFPFRGGGP